MSLTEPSQDDVLTSLAILRLIGLVNQLQDEIGRPDDEAQAQLQRLRLARVLATASQRLTNVNTDLAIADGLPQSAIAKALGVSRQRVHTITKALAL